MILVPAMSSQLQPLAAVGVLAAFLVAGCGSSPTASRPSPEPTPTLVTAPDSARVDLQEPTFSDPTTIMNPLFPISDLTQVVQVGAEGDVALRHEITLLPQTKTIEWNGQQVVTVVSQFMAYGDGRILEVATDFFAQADDGSVWYFGEDVANYVDGVLDNHDGTWLAGKDGPPGMIMPADPQVGDVWRPENIPGFVFEEVTAKSITETVDGPQGPVEGAMLVEELLMDGVLEDKIFAPGYGEFMAQVVSEDELVNVSVGVPRDELSGSVPAELDTISTTASGLVGTPADWAAAETAIATLTSAWEGYQGNDVSPLTADQIDQGIEALRAGVEAQDEAATQEAAFDLAYAATDLRLRHEPPAAADLLRLDLISARVAADASTGEMPFVAGDAAELQSIWDRVSHTAADPSTVDGVLSDLHAAVEAADLAAASAAAEQLRTALADL